MKLIANIFRVLCLFFVSTVIADEFESPYPAQTRPDVEWYGSISTSYLRSSGEMDFYGNTPSVYGGMPTLAMDEGGSISIATGYSTASGWRFEGELMLARTRTRSTPVLGFGERAEDSFSVDADIESLAVMFNGIYDFNIGFSRIEPFIKVGLGVTRNKTRSAQLDVQYGSSLWDGTAYAGQSLTNRAFPGGQYTGLAWNLGVGINMEITDRLALSLEYGVIDFGEALTETDENGDALGFDDLLSEQLSLGVSFRF